MYCVKILDRYSSKVLETYEELFETEEEAAQYLFVLQDEFMAGANTLDLAGEDVIEPEDVIFVVDEV